MNIKGITVFTFTGPLLALEHFQMNEHAYVLVIVDFRMPELNGMELLRKKKELFRKLRNIVKCGLKSIYYKEKNFCSSVQIYLFLDGIFLGFTSNACSPRMIL